MVGTSLSVATIAPALRGVPRLWPGDTVVCVASGPSLTQSDVDACRGRARVLVINTSILMATWADAFHACDGRVWKWHADAIRAFEGLKFSMDGGAAAFGATVLRNCGVWGLSDDPMGVCNGRNSGYQAINLAYLLGARRIMLLGYDMQPGPVGESHWHGDHPNVKTTDQHYRTWLAPFQSIAKPLAAAGVDVVNCTRRTALTVFPQSRLEDVL